MHTLPLLKSKNNRVRSFISFYGARYLAAAIMAHNFGAKENCLLLLILERAVWQISYFENLIWKFRAFYDLHFEVALR